MKEQITKQIAPFFQPFQTYFLGEILAKHRPDQEEHFAEDQKINLYQFKQEFFYSFRSETKYSPEVVWYAIRSFIKGRKLGTWLTPEEYDALPRRDKTLDQDEFRTIYKKYWRWYQELCREKQYWDDIDLIRFCLKIFQDTPECMPKFSVIFCDEAQDFTILEAQLILKLSAYSQYQYDSNQSPALPTAFAGDQFQTLNPTGFNWSRLKDVFAKAFQNEGLQRISLDFKELNCNYRSKPAIVHFANTLQLLRRFLLKIEKSGLKPQETWWKDTASIPAKFIIDRNINADDLTTNAIQGTMFVIPYEEERISDWIPEQSNELEKQWQQEKKSFKHIPNLLTTFQAKGMEFPKAIVYKFGDYFTQEFQNDDLNSSVQKVLQEIRHNPDEEAIAQVAYQELSPGDYFKLSYFLTKLYVAITRAKEKLFIVDSQEGDRSFWKFFTVSEEEHKKYDDAQYGFILRGHDIGEMNEEDPEKVAKTLEQNGRDGEMCELLYKAARYWRWLAERPDESENYKKSCSIRALKCELAMVESSLKSKNQIKKRLEPV